MRALRERDVKLRHTNFCFSLGVFLITALHCPALHFPPVYVESVVGTPGVFYFLDDISEANQILAVVTPSLVSLFWVRIKVVLVRPFANACLERAFNYVSAHVISARV
jgi:hypothetical protein